MLKTQSGWAVLVTRRQGFAPERTVWLVGLGVALSLLGDTTLYVVLPTHTAQAGIALVDVGLMLSANRIIRIFLNGPSGVLLERIPRRRMMVPALFLGALSNLLYTIPGFWPMLVGRALWGMAWVGIWIGGNTMVLDLATQANRGRLVGQVQMWNYLGLGMGALLGGALTDALGYAPALTVCAAIGLAIAVVWWLLLPETKPHPLTPSPLRREGEEPPALNLSLHDAPHPSRTEQRDRLTPSPYDGEGEKEAVNAEVRRLSAAALGTVIGLMGLNWLIFHGMLGATLPLLAQERVGAQLAVAGMLIPLATYTGALAAGKEGVSLLSAPLSGWLSDVMGNRWLLVMGALALGSAALALAVEGIGTVVLIAILTSAVATSVLQTQATTLVGDYARAGRQGRFLGLLNTVGDVGSSAGPLLAFALLPLVKLSGVYWLSSAALVAVFPLVVWVAWRARKAELKDTSPSTPLHTMERGER